LQPSSCRGKREALFPQRRENVFPFYDPLIKDKIEIILPLQAKSSQQLSFSALSSTDADAMKYRKDVALQMQVCSIDM